MSLLKKIIKFLFNSDYRFLVCAELGIYNNMPDDEFIKYKFKAKVGYNLNFEHPKTFNEKLQWLKLHDRNPSYTNMVDKYEAKEIVKNIIGEEYIIPTLGVWNSFDEIDFDNLPNQFVLKCTHDSGGLVIVKDKKSFDRNTAKKKIDKCLKHNYYLTSREWPYKNVKPRIIAEKYMSDSHEDGLFDYKLMCFNGICKYIFTVTNRYSKNGMNVTFFDTLWNRQPFERHYKADPNKVQKPEKLAEMIKIAETLSKDLIFDRVDLYEIDGKIYFGEITFFPGAGFEEFNPEEYDKILGDCIKLPENIEGGGYVCVGNSSILWLHMCKKKDEGLSDYKFYCFNGITKLLLIATGRHSKEGVKMTFFDMDFNQLKLEKGHPSSNEKFVPPKNFEKMKEFSKLLSKNIPFLRCDFYESDGNLYFGELTFYPAAGFEPFEPEEWDSKLGEMLSLPR